MSKFCENCGSELKDTDQTCPNCGAAVENSTTKDVKNETTTATTTNTTPNNAEKKNNTKLYAIIGGIAGAVVLLIIILAIVFGSSYKKPIDYMFKGLEKANSKTFIKAFPKVMKDNIEDKYDDDELNDLMETFEKEVGEKVKITYKILDKEKIDKDDLEDVQDSLEDTYDDAKKSEIKVTAGYKVTVKITVKGKDDKESNSTTIYVYKIGGKWCLLSPSMS